MHLRADRGNGFSQSSLRYRMKILGESGVVKGRQDGK
jgi:repressor of nif and glnA expression